MSNSVCGVHAGLITLVRSGYELARDRDEFGEIIIDQQRDYRILRFDALCEQSKMCLRSPVIPVHHYIRAMLMAVAWKREGQVLMLGLGGGCLLRTLHAYDKTMPVDVVELRGRVVEMTRQYFSLPESAHIDYYVQDAFDFLLQHEQSRYSLVLSDLYSAMRMDPLQGCEVFLQLCRDRLIDGGWLVSNYLDNPHADSALYHALYRVFSDVFFCQTASGNTVIFATNDETGVSLDVMITKAKKLSSDIFGELGGLTSSLHRL